jgi:hypothetical protein
MRSQSREQKYQAQITNVTSPANLHRMGFGIYGSMWDKITPLSREPMACIIGNVVREVLGDI